MINGLFFSFRLILSLPNYNMSWFTCKNFLNDCFYKTIHVSVHELSFYSGEKGIIYRFNSWDLTKNTPIFAIYKYQFEYKNKKLFNLKIYLREKKEEKLNLYLTLHQVLRILKYFTNIWEAYKPHTWLTPWKRLWFADSTDKLTQFIYLSYNT